MQKIVLAFPLYRQVPVKWFFQFLQVEKDPLIGTVATEGAYIHMAMQTLVEMAFDKCPDFDRLVIWEHDMIPPLNALNRMANYHDEHHIVGSMYFKHEWPHHVMAWMKTKPPFYSPLTAEVTKTLVDNPALYEVDAVATGFTAIKREVFEQWDPKISMWHPEPPLEGHDLHFCNQAKKQGFKIFIDSGIGCGHLTMTEIGYGHSQEALAIANPPTWTEEGVPCQVG